MTHKPHYGKFFQVFAKSLPSGLNNDQALDDGNAPVDFGHAPGNS